MSQRKSETPAVGPKPERAAAPAETSPAEATVEKRQPRKQLADQARKGGRAVVEKYGRDYMKELGRRGARAVTQRYGLRFYSEIAARNKGVPKRKTGSG